MKNWVNAETGEKIKNKEAAEKLGIEVITKDAYRKRHEWVNAKTGEEITNKEEAKKLGIEVITKTTYRKRHSKMNAETGEAISDEIAARNKGIQVVTKYSYRKYYDWVNAETGEKITNKEVAETIGIEVITKSDYQKLHNQKKTKKTSFKEVNPHNKNKDNWVSEKTGEKIKNKEEAAQRSIKVITKDAYRMRNGWVNAETGEEITNKEEAEKLGIKVISRRSYRIRHDLVNAETGEEIANREEAEKLDIKVSTREAYRRNHDWVNAETGEKIENKEEAEELGIHVITRNAYQISHNHVNAETGEKIKYKAEAEQSGIKVITKNYYSQTHKAKRKLGSANTINSQHYIIEESSNSSGQDSNEFYDNNSLKLIAANLQETELNSIYEDFFPNELYPFENYKEDDVDLSLFFRPPKKIRTLSEQVVPSPLTKDELFSAISVLRGDSNATLNDTYLVIDMLEFIKTRQFPSKTSNESPGTLVEFNEYLAYKKQEVTGITKQIESIITNRNTLFFNRPPTPYQAEPESVAENYYDSFQPYVTDSYKCIRLKKHHSEVTSFLKQNAEQSVRQEFFGVINLESSIQTGSQMLVFYALPTAVYFIDGQFINDGKVERPPVFESLQEAYQFEDFLHKKRSQASFSCDVIILPISSQHDYNDTNEIGDTTNTVTGLSLSN